MTRNRLGSLGLAGCALLIALVTIAPPLRSSQPRHLHQAVTAGLYNQEHLLAGLEFLGGDAPVPDAPPAVFTALVMVPCAPPPHRVHDGPPGSLADSRAPPALA
ncbi:MAG TPA: hypothetical protein VLA62_01320 [Solirubrobacterales bacterium]|nr:hypothetical protein [Solirubrobacterales bacterium]